MDSLSVCVGRIEGQLQQLESLPWAELYLSVPSVFDPIYDLASLPSAEISWARYLGQKNRKAVVAPTIVVYVQRGAGKSYSVRGVRGIDVRIARGEKVKIVPVAVEFIGEKNGHSSLVLIFPREKALEFFDPQGPGARWTEAVERALIEDLRPGFRDWTFRRSEIYCPRESWQAKYEQSKHGTCLLYANLYALLRTACPEIPPDRLTAALLFIGANRLRALLANLLMDWWHHFDPELYESVRRYVLLSVLDWLKTGAALPHLSPAERAPIERQLAEAAGPTGQITEERARLLREIRRKTAHLEIPS